MSRDRAKKIWQDGRLVDWEKATVHVLSHALHYGSSWFEGIRCYGTPRGPEVFRLDEHVRRLFQSCRIYQTAIPFTKEQIRDAILDTIRANGFEQCYIRPLVFRGLGSLGVDFSQAEVNVIVAAWEWAPYLGTSAIDEGVDVCVSSWNRPAPNTYPTLSKAGGNYLNSALIKMEAASRGFVEGIALDSFGLISEGSGENLFLVMDGVLHTPADDRAILHGITRDSVLTLAREFGYEVRESTIPREMLYVADELFFTGTAVEVTPIRSVDGVAVGEGTPGPVTARIQQAFYNVVQGREADSRGWMTPVLLAATEP